MGVGEGNKARVGVGNGNNHTNNRQAGGECESV